VHNNRQMEPAIIFCFHLLHHLNQEQRNSLYSFIKESNSIAVFVEPNPYNPLLILQILLEKDMSFKEEAQYLVLTKNRYIKELVEQQLRLLSYSRICVLPPFVLDKFLKKFSAKHLNFERFTT